jgi:hypothetical protein
MTAVDIILFCGLRALKEYLFINFQFFLKINEEFNFIKKMDAKSLINMDSIKLKIKILLLLYIFKLQFTSIIYFFNKKFKIVKNEL